MTFINLKVPAFNFNKLHILILMTLHSKLWHFHLTWTISTTFVYKVQQQIVELIWIVYINIL